MGAGRLARIHPPADRRCHHAQMGDAARTINGPEVLRSLIRGLSVLAMLVIGFVYWVSGLVAPVGAVVGLMICWIGLVVLGVRWFRAHPWRLPALPVAAVLVWIGVLTLGERLLGWTA